MRWDKLVQGAQRVLSRTLAASATITYQSSTGLGTVDLTGRALFRARQPRNVQLDTGEVVMQGDYPWLGVIERYLPGGKCHRGDIVTVIIDSVTTEYRVAQRNEDGEGSLDIELERPLQAE